MRDLHGEADEHRELEANTESGNVGAPQQRRGGEDVDVGEVVGEEFASRRQSILMHGAAARSEASLLALQSLTKTDNGASQGLRVYLMQS